MLEPGRELTLTSTSTRARITRLVGEGSQGTVWEVDVGGERGLALKWYHQHTATERQREVIERVVGFPPPNDRFLWPLEIVTDPDERGFGYTMRLRPDGYAGLVDRVAGRTDLSFRSLATIGLELADGFLQLHARGLCYRDVSFGNVFFEAEHGHVLICDNDNVAIDGAGDTTVLGTPYFMAPEVVRGDAVPSARTDRYSLAVLLFYLLMVHHPLEGARTEGMWDDAAMLRALGTEPLFIMDPDDRSNAPVSGVHDNPILLWNLYPKFVRELFVRSFTTGLVDPVEGRVLEGVWRAAFVQLRDGIVYCPRCAKQNLTDGDTPTARACWSCDATLVQPPRLQIGRNTVLLNHDARVYRHHLRLDYDFDTEVAQVAQHPQDPTIWGLRNCTVTPWKVSTPDGETRAVDPGRSVTLIPGTTIEFEGGRAESAQILA